MNGMMQHEYGVGLEDIHWFMGGLESPDCETADSTEVAG